MKDVDPGEGEENEKMEQKLAGRPPAGKSTSHHLFHPGHDGNDVSLPRGDFPVKKERLGNGMLFLASTHLPTCDKWELKR